MFCFGGKKPWMRSLQSSCLPLLSQDPGAPALAWDTTKDVHVFNFLSVVWKSRETSSKTSLLCPFPTPRAQNGGAVKGFWLNGRTTTFLVALQLNCLGLAGEEKAEVQGRGENQELPGELPPGDVEKFSPACPNWGMDITGKSPFGFGPG